MKKNLAIHLLMTCLTLVLVSHGLFSSGNNGMASVQAQERETPATERQNLPITEWPSKEKRFAIIIGVDRSTKNQTDPEDHADRDALKLANALSAHADFPATNILLITASTYIRPTRQDIIRAFSEVRQRMPKDGLLLVSFAGAVVQHEGQSYLLPSDVKMDGDNSLLETRALNAALIKELIISTGAEQVVMLLDVRSNKKSYSEDAQALAKSLKEHFIFQLKTGSSGLNSERGTVRAFATLYQFEEGSSRSFTEMVADGISGDAARTPKRFVTLEGLIYYIRRNTQKNRRFGGMGGLMGAISSSKTSTADASVRGVLLEQPPAIVGGYSLDGLVVAVSLPQENQRNAGTGSASGGNPAAPSTNARVPIENAQPVMDTDSDDANVTQATIGIETGRLVGNAASPARTSSNAEINNKIAEQYVWDSISKSQDTKDYQAYLRRYPAGIYANLAKLRTLALENRPSVEVQRYPNMTCPEEVVEDQEFTILVSLDETQKKKATHILQGKKTPDDKLVADLPDNPEQGYWQIEVVLDTDADDFTIKKGANTSDLKLPKTGDSIPASFKLRTKAIQEAEKLSRVTATLWFNGSFLAKIARDVKILKVQTESKLESSDQTRGINNSPKTKTPLDSIGSQTAIKKGNVGTRLNSQPVTGPPPDKDEASVSESDSPPATVGDNTPKSDLTLYIERVNNTQQPRQQSTEETVTYRLTIHSLLKLGQIFHGSEFTLSSNLPKAIALEYSKINELRKNKGQAGGAGGSSLSQPEEARVHMRGLCVDLYEKYAPESFKEAFWLLSDKYGKSFKSIQIMSDDMALPWELMCPLRKDAKGNLEERGFLGVEFAIGRLHIDRKLGVSVRELLPVPVDQIYVIAPDYKVNPLVAQKEELDMLSGFSGYKRWPARLDAMDKLLSDFPQGIIHFAGHGVIEQTPQNISEYLIELEDGRLDQTKWRGMVHNPKHNHPFVFFNACDMGLTQRVANFIDGWAPLILDNEASGYIGALWPVEDAKASEFGVEFYKAIKERAKIGPVAVAEVLMDTRRMYLKNMDPTFLSYVYFGDASMKLYFNGNK